MRYRFESTVGVLLSTVLSTSILVSGPIAEAQEASQGTVIDLRKYQHVDGTIRTPSQTFIPGYTRLPRAEIRVDQPVANDLIVVQPQQVIRQVGHLREKMSVVRGAALLGRNDFEISCSIGAAYAQIPGEEVSYRFARQADCKSILQSTSVTQPCRSRLSINRKSQTITLVGKACDSGLFAAGASGAEVDKSMGISADANEADSLSERARSARSRARQSAR